jgi:L-fuculose-phosphate aldolase
MAYTSMTFVSSSCQNQAEYLTKALEVRGLCEQYWRSLQIGKPKILSREEMARVLEKFKGYGQDATQE